MFCVGIDAGSRSIKIAIVSSCDGAIVGTGITHQGIGHAMPARALYENILGENRISSGDIDFVIATGYGRNSIDFADKTITEITCHGVGVRALNINACNIIDIGGQDSKFIRLDPDGSVCDFAMNDRCAAGTGCFMEMVAQRLGVPLTELGTFAAASSSPALISSMCAVFAETEIIGLVAQGITPADIIAGVQNSIAARLASMIQNSNSDPVVFTGGVALISGMDRALESVLKRKVFVSPQCQFTGAIGAAILAGRAYRQRKVGHD